MKQAGWKLFVAATILQAALGACSTDSGDSPDGGASVDGGADAPSGPLAVNAGADQTVMEPIDTVTLNAVVSGSASAGATVAWTQTSGAGATLSGAATTQLTVKGLSVGSYGFRVTAKNAANDTASDDVSVTVLSNATLCNGTTYYVSATGKDTNAGTQGSPWATLAKATATVTSAGSTIHLAAGTYVETAQSQLAPGVCIEGEGTSTIIKSTLTADWTPIIHATSPEGTDGHQHISGLKLDGQNLSTFWAIEVAGRSNFSIHDVTVVDFKDRGVLVNGRADNKAEAPTKYATGITFYANTILNSAAYDGVYGRGCLNVGGTEGMRIYGNTITQNQRPVGQNGWPIKGSNDGHNKGLKIYDNKLTKIPFTGAYGGDGGWDFAVEMFYDQGTEFYGNTVSGGGFDTNWQLEGSYPYSLWIHDNVFTLPAASASNNDAIILEFDSHSAIIENNVIDKMSNCVLFTPRPGNTISKVSIRGNLCSHVGKTTGNGSNASFINIGPGGTDFTVDGLDVFNNTFLADPANRPWWGIELGGTTAGKMANVSIKNNLIAHVIAGAIVQGAPGGVVMDKVAITNNDIFDVTDTNDPKWTGTTPTNLVYTNNLHVDPMFVSPTDYHLQAGSPAIDKGVDVGRPFKGTAPDMGYVEY